ncbi:MAG: chloride channel protein, partial [Acidimicrobiia bacterium]|nr:chloride channel protein [Acidimicrobiia bacterium]
HDRIRSLVAAGAGAGIAASFNAPIAGMLFAMEVILGSFAIRHLNAVIIASVSASVTTKLLVGEELILTSPPHGLGNFRELLLFALLAVISVTAGLLYLRSEDWFATLKEWNPLPAWSAPVLGGLAVAALGIGWPDSLGTGREFLSQLLSLDNPAGYVWYSVLILAVVKIFTATMTVASDGSAGSFMPALVVGGMVGTGFALALDPLWTFDTLNPGAFAVVGMACTLTTTTRAPMTAVLLVFELTGNYELVLPLMLGTALATLLGDRLHADSTYTMPLRRMGIALPKHEDIDLLDMVTVDVVMSAPDRPLRPWNSLAEAVEYFEVSGHHGSPVLNDQDELIGVLSLSDIADAGGPSHSVTVAAAMTKDLITVTPDLPVSTALARMASLGVGRLPVVGTTDPHRLLGMFRRQSVVKAYDHALSMSKGRELYRERKRIRMQPGADFFEVAVSADSWLTNAAISTVAWPQDCVLVSIQRGTQVLVPHGDTVLRAGDTLTAFGSSDANDELDRLITRPQEEESAP